MEKMNPHTLLIKGETVDTTLENHLVASPHKRKVNSHLNYNPGVTRLENVCSHAEHTIHR